MLLGPCGRRICAPAVGQDRTGAGQDLLPSSGPHPSAPSASLCRAEPLLGMRGEDFPLKWLLLCACSAPRPLFSCSFSAAQPTPAPPWGHRTRPLSRWFLCSPSLSSACPLWEECPAPVPLLPHLVSIPCTSINTPEQGTAQQHIHTPWNCPPPVPCVPLLGCSRAWGEKPFLVKSLKPPKLLMCPNNYCSPTQTFLYFLFSVYFLPLPLACRSPNWFIFKLKYQFAKCRNMWIPSSCPLCPAFGVQPHLGTKTLLGEVIKVPKVVDVLQ